MDDMNAFERQVVGQIQRWVGPPRLVDDAAILNVILASQSPKWRFLTMFSVSKFVVAGALVLAVASAPLLARSFGEQQDSTPAAEGPAPSPVVVEGRIGWGIEATAPTVESVPETDLLEYRGRTTEGPTLEMSDARLEGTATITSNLDRYRGSVGIFTGVLRIENDEGAWQGHPTVGVIFPDGSETTNTFALEGEGAYEGLTAVLEFSQGSGFWTVAGAILGGDAPPAPESMTTQ